MKTIKIVIPSYKMPEETTLETLEKETEVKRKIPNRNRSEKKNSK